MPPLTTTTYSPPDRYYRFGSATLCLSAPPFTESDRWEQFTCPPGPADLTVRIRNKADPQVPPGKPRHTPGAEWYRTENGATAVVRDLQGMLLWVAEYRDNGAVEAEVNTASGMPLTSFVVSEIIDLPRLLLRRGSLFLHASFVLYGGQAILFTAPKQTGKSTQAALWERHAGAETVNGDRALIETRGGVCYACATPYAGTSKICRRVDAPIRAVVILSQGKENEARRATAGEAFRALLEGGTVDRADPEQMALFLNAAEVIAASLPFYALRCLPDEGAVDCLKKALALDTTQENRI